jgi:hypothetical protein
LYDIRSILLFDLLFPRKGLIYNIIREREKENFSKNK